jgi:hypothetical protein
MSLVVKTHNPWKTRILYILAAIALGAAAWAMYDYGRFSAGYDSRDAGQAYEEMLDIKDDLEKQVVELREQKALLERAAQIEREAYNDLDATLKVLQGEILELKEELAFYRGIVSPRVASRGLHLQRVEINSLGESRTYRYKVVLTQVLKNDRLASGKVKIQIHGLRDGEPAFLTLRQITEKSVKDLSYRFKYFQTIEGDIELPEAFTPLRMRVEILPRGREKDKIDKTIEWPNEENVAHVGKKQETEVDNAD